MEGRYGTCPFATQHVSEGNVNNNINFDNNDNDIAVRALHGAGETTNESKTKQLETRQRGIDMHCSTNKHERS